MIKLLGQPRASLPSANQTLVANPAAIRGRLEADFRAGTQ